MGKYIWPHQLGKAAVWYLEIFSGKRKLSIDALIAEQIRDNSRRNYDRHEIRRHLSYLTETGLLTKDGKYRNATYGITSLGLKRLESLSLSAIKARSHSWDGKWRIVFFDIPESSRSARDQIRRLLKELGFRQLQLSVWVHPLPCLDYFREIQQAYGISEHLFLAQVTDLNVPSEIIKYFQKAYPNQKIK